MIVIRSFYTGVTLRWSSFKKVMETRYKAEKEL